MSSGVGSVRLMAAIALLGGVLWLAGCPGEIPETSNTPAAAGGAAGNGAEGYVILGTRTDNFNFSAAKSLAEDALAAHPDLDCMVGLFAYNPPYMLEALKGAGRAGEVQLVAFDEADETLQAIKDGYCYGTVVQDPYRYGYESVRILAALARGDESELPEGGFLDIPARKITKANVDEFWAELRQRLQDAEAAGKKKPPAGAADRPRVAFVTNGIASFWLIAEAGARKAAQEFDVDLEVRMPPEGIGDQKRMIEELLTLGVDGMAVSPIDPANQTDLLNAAAEQTPLITHDSDAPDSNRLAYVGMSNYDAGRLCGELVKEALPGGGSIMIFVGRIEQDNARLRRQGLIDELLDRSHDPTRFDPPGKVIRSGD
jgi:ribose transport system substrate-binding protein